MRIHWEFAPPITTLLRKRNIEYTIPAHTKLVSNVRFERNNGDYMVSTSYDGTAKVSIINNGGSIKVSSYGRYQLATTELLKFVSICYDCTPMVGINLLRWHH